MIAHNPLLAGLIEETFGNEVFVPPEPQYIGALGAALVALGDSEKEA